MKLTLCAILFATWLFALDPPTAKLAHEVATKGWIVYTAKTEKGDWDVFVMRPDGTHKRNLTNTSDSSEMGARFSPDGKKILFRRIPLNAKIRHDSWGATGQLVIANSDGTGQVTYGEAAEWPWAVWSPNGKQVSCLTKTGIEIRDLASKEVVRKLDRKGIFQQMFWSPDGKWFTGTANFFGENWTVVRMNAETGDVSPIAKFQNCTADWFPDSKRVINSYRPKDQEEIDGDNLAQAVGQKPKYGWTQLWMTDADGSNRKMVMGEDGKHIYGGAISPDGKYVLFTPSMTDGGIETGMISIMRLADAPIVRGESKALRKLHPEAKDGVILELTKGWEPHWTYAALGVK
jgi:Tol biopolymer transport system component